MVTQKELNNYFSQVKKNCPREYRTKMMPVIKGNVLDYLEENPDSSMSDVTTQFGVPEKFATEYIMTIDDTERTKILRTSKFIKRIVIVGIVAVVLIIAVTAAFVIADNSHTAAYYYHYEITE